MSLLKLDASNRVRFSNGLASCYKQLAGLFSVNAEAIVHLFSTPVKIFFPTERVILEEFGEYNG